MKTTTLRAPRVKDVGHIRNTLTLNTLTPHTTEQVEIDFRMLSLFRNAPPGRMVARTILLWFAFWYALFVLPSRAQTQPATSPSGIVVLPQTPLPTGLQAP